MKEVICCLLLTISSNCLFAQENQKTTAELKKKYSFVKYDDSYGGWYYVKDINDKVGACNKKGKLIVPCKYDYVKYAGDSYQVKARDASFKEWWGACDANGKEIIPPIYESCSNLRELIELSVSLGSREYVNKNNKSNKNYFLITDADEKEGVIDLSGKTILECKYDHISAMDLLDYGICQVRLDDKYGLYNEKGQQIVPFIYELMFLNKSDKSGKIYFTARQNRLYGLIDITGKRITDIEYDEIGDFSEGLCLCQKGATKDGKGNKKGGLYGYLDETGKMVIPIKYDDASSFKDGVAQVVENGVASLLTNPLTGTKLNIQNGGGSNVCKVDINIPVTDTQNSEMFAFIFACENYGNMSGADYSINDGLIFKEYCSKTLGLPDKSIRYYEDATYGNMVSAIQKMQDIADVYEGEAKILFYFSGLGATDETTKEAYLLPTDASLSSLSSTGYNMGKLLKDLNELKTQITVVIVDAPFSGVDKTGKAFANHRGVAISHKSYIPQRNMVVCMSSSNNENTFSDKKYGHSLFTYALLDKLQQTKGACKIKDLMEYAIDWTKKNSWSDYDKIQTPQIILSEELKNNWPNIKF